MIFVENSWFPPIAKMFNPFKFGRRYFQSVFVCVCVCVYENSFFFFFIQQYFPATLSLLLWISGHRAYFDFIFVYVHHLYFYF